jgi:hypothetical protein
MVLFASELVWEQLASSCSSGVFCATTDLNLLVARFKCVSLFGQSSIYHPIFGRLGRRNQTGVAGEFLDTAESGHLVYIIPDLKREELTNTW